MKFVADLHIHSRYSRATSRDLNIENLEKYAKIKGVGLMGTGDFSHPEWNKELKENLVEDGTGFLRTKTGFPFILSNEISLMYTQDGQGRRVHLVLFAPDLLTVDEITKYLLSKGRIDYDGRPIFKIPCPEFVESIQSINDTIEVVPAHIWTPWFGLLGSKTGFDKVKDCFLDMTKHIHALETGLSSDPAMNWRLSQLDRYTLLSNSDLHSYWPWRLGREANVMDIEPDYKSFLNALHTRRGMKRTIEVDPNYGKYHLDGHRNCGIRMEPAETRRHQNICPVCKKPLTIGVLNRVEELADREDGFKHDDAIPYNYLVPISEIIAKIENKGIATQKVWATYNSLIEKFGDEMNVALTVPDDELARVVDTKVVDAIIANRKGKITVEAGFDGEYGYPVFSEEDKKVLEPIEAPKDNKVQKGLGEYL